MRPASQDWFRLSDHPPRIQYTRRVGFPSSSPLGTNLQVVHNGELYLPGGRLFRLASPLQFQGSRYAPFDADRYAATGLASSDSWRFGFYPDGQGGRVARFAAMDGLGIR